MAPAIRSIGTAVCNGEKTAGTVIDAGTGLASFLGPANLPFAVAGGILKGALKVVCALVKEAALEPVAIWAEGGLDAGQEALGLVEEETPPPAATPRSVSLPDGGGRGSPLAALAARDGPRIEPAFPEATCAIP
jgi:hypothetical protein